MRGGHQFAFGGAYSSWKSLSLANVRSPGQFTIDGTITGLGLADFLLGRLGTNGLVQAAPNTLDMYPEIRSKIPKSKGGFGPESPPAPPPAAAPPRRSQ